MSKKKNSTISRCACLPTSSRCDKRCRRLRFCSVAKTSAGVCHCLMRFLASQVRTALREEAGDPSLIAEASHFLVASRIALHDGVLKDVGETLRGIGQGHRVVVNE